MDRVTSAGGYLLLGMPAVNRLMEFAFRAIGFKINDHHVSAPRDLWKMQNAFSLYEDLELLVFDGWRPSTI